MCYVCQVGGGWRKVWLSSQEQGSEIYQKEDEGANSIVGGGAEVSVGGMGDDSGARV